MTHVAAVVGIVVLLANSSWVVSKAGGGPPIIAHILHPRRRDRPDGVQEDDDIRWHWGPR
jgi:hypothetical protein